MDVDSLHDDSDWFDQDKQNEIDFTDLQEESVTTLKNEVKILKKQVKYLRKMVMLNMFDTKQDVRDFFSDIW